VAREKSSGSRAEQLTVRAGEFDALQNVFDSRVEVAGEMERKRAGNRGRIHKREDYEAAVPKL
jgi:hypothetical protein